MIEIVVSGGLIEGITPERKFEHEVLSFGPFAKLY